MFSSVATGPMWGSANPSFIGSSLVVAGAASASRANGALGELVQRRLHVLDEQLQVADHAFLRLLSVVEDEHDVLGRQLLPLLDELVPHLRGVAHHPEAAVDDRL